MNVRNSYPVALVCVLCAVCVGAPLGAQKPRSEPSGHAKTSESQLVPCDSAWVTVLVVRHADRAGQADSLSAAGVKRAVDLAHVAAAAGVTAIYHSDTKRTRDTAAPLAAALGITPEVYPAKDMAALGQMIRNHYRETVLVVGHSNTVPMIVALGGGPTIAEIAEDTFDDLFVLRFHGCDMEQTTMVHLHYGAPTP